MDAFAATDEARRVQTFEDRARADVEIVDRLMFAGYHNPRPYCWDVATHADARQTSR